LIRIKKGMALIMSAFVFFGSASAVFAETETCIPDSQEPSVNCEESNNSALMAALPEEKMSDQTDNVVKPFSGFKDAQSHWAKDTLNRAYNDGILSGFEDGTMRPDTKITGAQMVTIITRVLNTQEKADISGYNLSSNCWYRDAAAESLALGIIEPSQVATLDTKMVRREACAMMSDAFQLSDANPDFGKAEVYSDFNTLSMKYKIIFASLVNKGYIQGYNGSLMLANDITRAEFITLLYRVAGNYLNTSDVTDYSALTCGTVLNGSSFEAQDCNIPQKIWLGAGISSVDMKNVKASEIVIRGDVLEKLSIENSTLNRLVLASRGGDVNLNCSGISRVVAGSGTGNVYLSPRGNIVEVTGSGRNVILDELASELSISGNNNVITVNSSADVEKLNILGQNNTVKVDSYVREMVIKGKGNTVSGLGTAENVILYTSKSNIDINQGNVSDKTDSGITGMTASISAPVKLVPGNTLTAKLKLSNYPAGKTVKVIWYKDGKEVKNENITLNSSEASAYSAYIAYSESMPASCKISAKVEYTTFDDEKQTVSAQDVTVTYDKSSSSFFDSIVAKVTTYYKGNRTTQWAIDHNLSNYEKEVFVNYKGYSSATKYLIWVNIGTQYTSVFLGSKGNWKLVRSGLVSTGANDCTPRGVFKTTYKQSNWTTDTYTVKPIVRFYGGGYAFHSRLYQPGTMTLKSGNNGVGYPLSHGCVRMQADDIQWLYDYVPNGTTVVVY